MNISIAQQKNTVEKLDQTAKQAVKFRSSMSPIVKDFLGESTEAQLAGSLCRQVDALEKDLPILAKKIDTLKRLTMRGSNENTTSPLGKKLEKILDKAIQSATKHKCTKEDGRLVIKTINIELSIIKQELNKTKKAQEKASNQQFSF